ncbi:hypothetical protein Hanom_Chr06g00557901 [Helianthus anomalus]
MFHPFLPILPPINVRCPQRNPQLNATIESFASLPSLIQIVCASHTHIQEGVSASLRFQFGLALPPNTQTITQSETRLSCKTPILHFFI